MITRKRTILFLLQFPVTLLVGILLSFAYSLRMDDRPQIDWVIAVILALVINVVVTLLNRRDEKVHHYAK